MQIPVNLHANRSILEGFRNDEAYNLLGPNSFLVLGYLQLLVATTSCNSRERLAVREEFPQDG